MVVRLVERERGFEVVLKIEGKEGEGVREGMEGVVEGGGGDMG